MELNQELAASKADTLPIKLKMGQKQQTKTLWSLGHRQKKQKTKNNKQNNKPSGLGPIGHRQQTKNLFT